MARPWLLSDRRYYNYMKQLNFARRFVKVPAPDALNQLRAQVPWNAGMRAGRSAPDGDHGRGLVKASEVFRMLIGFFCRGV
jgi:hypothetical protein